MQILLSPSKTLDETSVVPQVKPTQPAFLEETEQLAKVLKAKKSADLQTLMGISEKLGDLNYERYQNFQTPFTKTNARPALFTFKGDVYEGMDVANYSVSDLEFAQQHLCILSGFYGLLRPLDLMQPYRLEMGTRLENVAGNTLYQFWGTRLTNLINKSGVPVVNLASQEYFKAVQTKKLKQQLVTIDFKENKDGMLKTIGIMAKRARGAMADYIIKNRIEEIEELKGFSENGYTFQPNLSDESTFVFVAKRSG